MKATAAIHQLVDLVTWNEQILPATYYDIRSGEGRQLDRAFVRREHQHLVKKCFNASMMVNSDHETIRVNMEIERLTPPPKTKRQTRTAKAIAEHFHAHSSTAEHALAQILQRYEETEAVNGNCNSPLDNYDRLMTAINDTIDTIPAKKNRPRGWCEISSVDLQLQVSERNKAARLHAKKNTAHTRLVYKEKRGSVRKAMRQAKNAWLHHMISKSNLSLTPQGKKGNDAHAIWKMVTKLKRGVSKWKHWNFKNIQND